MPYSSGLITAALAGAYVDPPFICAGARSVQLTVGNAAVYVQLGRGAANPVWSTESYKLPGVHTIPGPIDALRVRSATTATPAPVWSADGYV